MTSTISEMALFVTRWVELSILGKATIVLVLGLVAARLAHRGRASMRHLFLVVTFGMLVGLPLIIITTSPKVTIDVPVSRQLDSREAVSSASSSAPLISSPNSSVGRSELTNAKWSLPAWSVLLRLMWIGGAVLLFVSLGISLLRLRRIRSNGLPWPESRELIESLAIERGVRRPVELLLNENIPAPLTFGMWSPVVLLPAEARNWSESRLRSALVHEMEHVRRSDWITQLAARATCACYWFHPLVWVAWRRLCLEAERACDDAVVQNAERVDYAEQLVLLAQQMTNTRAHLAIGMANRSDLSTRVSAVLDGGQLRGRVGLPVAATAIIAACILVFAIAPVRAVSRSNNATIGAKQESQSSASLMSREASPIDRALFEAAESGDIASIDKLLKDGANVNCALDGDGSPLIGAARSGHLDAVRLLLDRGADPNMPVPGDGNPLIMAARDGHADVVALLLDRGAIIDQMVRDDENALIQASGNGHLAVVKLLVSRGADVNAGAWADGSLDRKGEWRSPLSMARKGNYSDVVEFLLASGAREN